MDKFPLMTAKLRLVFTITIVFLSFYGTAQTGYWQKTKVQKNINKRFAQRFDVEKGQQFTFDEALFKKELAAVSASKGNSKLVYFPDEKGALIAFQVFETPVFSPELSRKYSNIKSYSGRSIDTKTKIRFSVSHKGIQSMMVQSSTDETLFMQKDAGNKYVLYKRDPNAKRNEAFLCETQSVISKVSKQSAQKTVNDQVLRKYRLAVTASGEYTAYHGGTVTDALAAINATVTRINEVFETDLAVTLEVVAGLESVIFTDAETDPYSGSLSPKVQNTLDTNIGSANYDVGILFNQAGQSDGNAGFIGAVCVENRKGSAYATGQVPEGDLFDIDFVAHEIGHQFGANHTWSFESEGTQVQVEPGSGTSIMGYAGITGINNVAQMGEDYFHYVSIVQITDYIKTTTCAEEIVLTNVPPVITPVGSFTIPKSTAFSLTGNATDADADVLTYTWEQVDDGVVPQSVFGPSNPSGANFRSQKPNIDSTRYFPKLSSVILGRLTQENPNVNSTWETVSDVEREMNFALTVRDNALGGGQVVSDLVNVFVENSAGPFIVTSQSSNVVASAGTVQTITWDVGNTNRAPINTETVTILLSTDGGVTFPIILAENAVNDGSHDVVIPGFATTTARIMIRADDNIYFAVNTSDFEIEASEIVLSFDDLEQEVCQADILVVPFVYNTFEGFVEEATFSIIDAPVGLDVVFFPETATATDTEVNLTLSDTENLAVGSYPIRVLATTASIQKEVTFNLNVYDTSFSEVTLVAPADGLTDTPTGILLEWEAEFLATSYDIEIATDAGFGTIVETASLTDVNYVPSNLNNQTQYFWRVKPKNSCGEGVFSQSFSFTTIDFSCINVTGGSLPASISSSGTPTVTSEITILDDLPVADINVNLKIDHTYLSDLTITLTSPSGTSVVLMSNRCEEFRNIDAIFDDAGSAIVCGGMPAVSGTVKPQGSLASFNGESTLGTWVLTVADNAPADGGEFQSFAMEICAEGQFRPDDDNDGVFDDGPDLCLGTPENTPVDASGCAVSIFPATNFTIEIQGETCRANDDGSIMIEADLSADYNITVTGNGVNISDSFSTAEYALNDLMAGVYSLCISATKGEVNYREQCFEIVVEEPDPLSVSSKISVDGSTVELQLQGGLLYNVALNGVVIQTEKSSITLNLKEGGNELKVSTNIPCQGAYSETFFYGSDPVFYPNPFTDKLTLGLGAAVHQILIQIYSVDGRLIYSKLSEVNGVSVDLDLASLNSGLYFVKYEAENIKGTSKIIKK